MNKKMIMEAKTDECLSLMLLLLLLSLSDAIAHASLPHTNKEKRTCSSEKKEKKKQTLGHLRRFPQRRRRAKQKQHPSHSEHLWRFLLLQNGGL
jgi:hypothetical protein